jgi:hypothetical protein
LELTAAPAPSAEFIKQRSPLLHRGHSMREGECMTISMHLLSSFHNLQVGAYLTQRQHYLPQQVQLARILCTNARIVSDELSAGVVTQRWYKCLFALDSVDNVGPAGIFTSVHCFFSFSHKV